MDVQRSVSAPLIQTIGLLQGVALYLLHDAIKAGTWPADDLPWLIALYVMALAWPLQLLLSLTHDKTAGTVVATGLFSLLLAASGYYLGTQSVPPVRPGLGAMIATFALAASIATFKAVMYLQQQASGSAISYPGLYEQSWRNFLSLGLALLFTLVLWGILALWGGLFSLIGISFFADLFSEPWFFYPVLGLTQATAIYVLRGHAGIVDMLRGLQQALMRLLLPLLAALALTFLATLLVSGPGALWATGMGTLMLLWLQALVLFFINGVYQYDADNRPYTLLAHRFVWLGVLTLPVYGLISAWGLYLRIDQYGLTLDRCWAVLVCVLLLMFSTGYLYGIVRRRDDWVRTLGTTNIGMGLVVLLSMLLVNSPLLDFRKLVVASQLQRLADGTVSVEKFDYNYFFRTLGKPGHDALVRLKAETDNKLLKDDIEGLLDSKAAARSGGNAANEVVTVEGLLDATDVLPAGSELPGDLPAAILDNCKYIRCSRLAGNRNLLYAHDFDDDPDPEFLFIVPADRSLNVKLFDRSGEGWSVWNVSRLGHMDMETLRQVLSMDNASIVQPRWRELHVGELVMRPTTRLRVIGKPSEK